MPLRVPTGFNGYTDPVYVGPRPRVFLGTSVTPVEEVFASLAYLSEVKKAGRDLLLRLGHPCADVDATYLVFRSFIRQARTFYESAQTLHHRAAALIYYYSFLNLAKAYICLTDPRAVSGKISHGLFYRFRDGKLSTQFLGVDGGGVFRAFYAKVTGKSLPRTFRPNICRLLTYCSDIAYECDSAGFGKHRATPCRHRFVLDTFRTKTAASMLAVAHFDRVEPYKKALKSFHATYDEVDVSATIPLIAETFGLTHPQARRLRYFESKNRCPIDASGNVSISVLLPEINRALAPFYLTSPFKDDFEFLMTVPWNLTQQIPFNEILATYAVMFYLGSLVRYNPAYLESIIESPDSWIIERFVNSCTPTFLRHMDCLIEQSDKVYFAR